MNGALARRLRGLLPGLWAGALFCIALIATPAPFATLATHEAGRVVAHIFLREAWLSLGLGGLLLLLERQRAASGGTQFSAEMQLVLGRSFAPWRATSGCSP